MALSKKWILRLQASDLSSSSNKTFTKNMAALEAKDITLYQKIAALPQDPTYELFRQPKDLYNLSLKNQNDSIQPYYNTEDILARVERNLNEYDFKNRRLIILCGIGLGYELLSFLNHYAQQGFAQTLLVIEKDPHIFKKCLEATDLSDIISDSRITFMVGHTIQGFSAAFHDYIAPLERLTLLKSMRVIFSDSSLKLHSAYYTEIVQALKATAIYMIKFFGNSPEDSLIGERHMFRNVKSILEHPGINLLYGAFSGKPAIVCASGPSLTAELPLLKTLQDQVLILSAESTFWALTAHGIHPHIMCTLERDVRPTGYFDRFTYDDVKDTYLATVPVVPPKMYESYLGPKINVYRDFNHFRWLPFDKGTLNIKKSSANMAFKLAHMLGCSPIILLGQDLCFDRETNLTHVQEHHHGANQTFFQDQQPISVPANDGQTARTSQTWLEFLQGYVIDVRDYGGDVINCSAQGAYIEGTRYLPFRQAVDEYLQEPYDPAHIIRQALASFTTASVQADLSLLRDKIDAALTDLARMVEICTEGVRYIDDFAERYKEALADLSVSAQILPALRAAQEKIETIKKSFMHSDTFQMIVLHVVQSYMIAFVMNLNEEYLALKSDGSIILYTIVKHREYFASLAALIDMIRQEVETAREITATVLSGKAAEDNEDICIEPNQDSYPDSFHDSSQISSPEPIPHSPPPSEPIFSATEEANP